MVKISFNDSRLCVILAIVYTLANVYFQGPTIGPERAVTLVLYSFRRASVVSNRENDVAYLKMKMRQPRESEENGYYLVVHGPEGIGKSTAIETAAVQALGVVFSEAIRPGTSCANIEKNALVALTNSVSNPIASASAVIWFYGLITWGGTPTVVLRASERHPNEPYAEIPQAARELSNRGIRVIVDSSDCALAFEHLSVRNLMYAMEPMSDELIKKATYFKELIKFLEDKSMLDVVLETCGGVPAFLVKLKDALYESSDDIVRIRVVKSFVRKAIGEAVKKHNAFILKYPQMSEFLEKFKDRHICSEKSKTSHLVSNSENKDHCEGFIQGVNELEAYPMLKSIQASIGSNIDFKPVLRRVVIFDEEINKRRDVFIPANGAMKIVLRAGFEQQETFETISEKVALWKKLRIIK